MRSLFGPSAGALALLGCAVSHDAPRPPPAPLPPPTPCAPDAGAGCPSGQVCLETSEGDHVCMVICEFYEDGLFCPTGEGCFPYRRPGTAEGVCWIGGHVPRGSGCEPRQCARGLGCNSESICDELCDRLDYPCRTPGYVCEWSNCGPPRPPYTPCSTNTQCSYAYNRCTAETGFTCQLSCIDSFHDPGRANTCLDGTPCSQSSNCPLGPIVRTDSCERTPEGSSGCSDGWVCAMTTLGVRRCMRAGCRPDGSGETRCRRTCLPHPEDPDTWLCWLGGTVELGEPCESSYECGRGKACGAEGVCESACTEEDAPCGAADHVCRNFVCTEEGE